MHPRSFEKQNTTFRCDEFNLQKMQNDSKLENYESVRKFLQRLWCLIPLVEVFEAIKMTQRDKNTCLLESQLWKEYFKLKDALEIIANNT